MLGVELSHRRKLKTKKIISLKIRKHDGQRGIFILFSFKSQKLRKKTPKLFL